MSAATRYVTGYNGSPLDRFLRNCRFDAGTGCVLWTGGTTAGRGHSVRYGAFWFEGQRWSAHRWSAKFIHKFNIDGLHVDHCCDEHSWLDYPNTLCVNHVKPETAAVNRELQTIRSRRVRQTIEQKRFWVHAQVGIIEPPPAALPHEAFTSVPFYDPPEWLRAAA